MSEEQSKSSLPETVVTEEEWAAWKDIPTTRTFRRFLKKQLEETYESWMGGAYTSPEGDQTLQLNSRAIGSSQMIRNILELTAADINQGMSDE